VTEFYVVDMRPSFRDNPYVTFWRPKNAGYAYPLPWSGRYSAETIEAGAGYYAERDGRSLIRFAAPCDQVDKLGTDPGPGMIDGDVGPVIVNSVENRRRLRRMATNALRAPS